MSKILTFKKILMGQRVKRRLSGKGTCYHPWPCKVNPRTHMKRVTPASCPLKIHKEAQKNLEAKATLRKTVLEESRCWISSYTESHSNNSSPILMEKQMCGDLNKPVQPRLPGVAKVYIRKKSLQWCWESWMSRCDRERQCKGSAILYSSWDYFGV